MAAAWGEYLWTRLRRMDYWNPARSGQHQITNAPAKMFRPHAPGLRVGRPEASLQKHDDKVGTNNFSVRYYNRDQIKRDTAYYPDTPLSSNHALMKGAALRPKDQITPDNMSLHVYGTSFGASDGTGQKFGTMAHMGMDKLVQEKDTTPPAMF